MNERLASLYCSCHSPRSSSSVKAVEANCLSIIYRVTADYSPLLEGMGSSSSSSFSSKSQQTRGIPHRFETLDLVVSNPKDFEMLASVLENLVEIHREERNRYDRDVLLMEHYWMELEKDVQHDHISAQDWIVLCDKLNVPLKKQVLMSMYKTKCSQMDDKHSLMTMNAASTPEGTDEVGTSPDGLSLVAVAELLEPLRKASLEDTMGVNEVVDMEDHGSRIWNDIVSTDPVPPLRGSEDADSYIELAVDRDEDEETISTVAFLSFIRSQQKEYRTALEDAAGLCHAMNRQVMISDLQRFDHVHDTDDIATGTTPKSLSTARLPKSRFLSYLWSDANDLLDPTKGEQGTIDMTRPLSNYWINTAHDTYLARLPNSLNSGRSAKDATDLSHHELVDEQMYWAALFRGVRCIELDVWDGLPTFPEPLVARKQPTPQTPDRLYIVFSEVLRIVKAFLQERPNSYPVILKLETHCSLPFQKIMAQQLVEVLGDILYIPQDSNGITKSPLATSASLPSPASLKGRVIIIGKRPKTLRQGATVINDDFDDENGVVVEDESLLNDSMEEEEDDDEDDADAIVVGFSERGPVKQPASTPGANKLSPSVLLDIATNDAGDAHREAKLAEKRLAELKAKATSAEMLAAKLTEEAGFTPAEVRAIAAADSSRDEVAPGGFEVELDLNDKNTVSVRGIEPQHPEEGLEVQDFFGDAVEGAKSQYTEADARALEANDNAVRALTRLNEAKLALQLAEQALKASYQREKDLAQEAMRAASDARTNREHADTARRRVETVRELLRSCADSANSAETVVVTAYTEAKISEQRASEAEARASRAMATADKDRAVADEESRKEEILEQEVEKLHVDYVFATKAARAARDRLEKATVMLDRVNEQIKLIEQSSQYQKEIREQRASSYLDDEGSQNSKPRHGSKFLDKHAAKVDERKMCQDLIKEASSENENAEQNRLRAQLTFEERAQVWRIQAERAASLRKQAERSSHIAEELAEHAEEEREAASLRHIAREKAQANVEQSDSYRASVEAQLAEAERAASEAASVAVESRNRAEQFAREAEKSKNHREAMLMVEHRRGDLESATHEYDRALAQKAKAENDAATAKRVLDTSSEVLSSAQRDAAAEIHRANEDRVTKRRAVDSYNKAINARKAADRAKEQFKIAKEVLAQKNAALKQAQQYKQRMDKVVEFDTGLATVTLVHSSRHKHWGKSLALPTAYMHSLAQGVVQQMVEKDSAKQREFFAAFTSNHLIRTFPSWQVTEHTPYANYDPVSQWSLGCQLVAMNFHSVDERVLVADGRFRANGSSGYILKPDYLIDDTKPRERQERWKFSILGASCLPKPESNAGRKGLVAVSGTSMHYINPYVKISVYDETTTSSGKVIHATKPVSRNGLNPVWTDKNDVEVAIPSPSLTILLFTVWDKTESGADDFIAAAACPVSCIREGYRSVALFDSLHTRSGPYAFCSLLVKAQKLSN